MARSLLWLALACGCAGSPRVPRARPDTSFLHDAAFQTSAEHLLVLGAEGLTSLRLDGRERRQLIDDRGCAYAGSEGGRRYLRCGPRLYLVAVDRVVELRRPPPALTGGDGRVSGCTSGAPECLCDGWRPRVSGRNLLWEHENGDSRRLARVTGGAIEAPFVTEDCQVAGFHFGGAVYLVHVPSERVGLLARGSTLQWPR